MAIFYLPEVEFLQMHAETNRKNSATENSIVTASAYILAIDQGTTSTRAILFDAACRARPQSEMAKLRGGDRWLAFIGADFVDDLQYALAIGAELHAEFRHDAAVVDHEVA
jgi:hypothetical protein